MFRVAVGPGAVAALVSVAVVGLNVASGFVLLWMLSAQERGAVEEALIWPRLFSMFAFLSLHEALVYRAKVSDAKSARSAFLVSQAILYIAFCFVAGSVWVLDPDHRAWDQVPLAIAYTAAYFASSAVVALSLEAADFWSYNTTRLVQAASYLGLLAALWAIDRVSVASVVTAQVVCVVSPLLVPASTARLVTAARTALSAPVAWVATWELLRTGAKAHTSTCLYHLTAYADRLFVVWTFPLASVGLYVAGLSIATAAPLTVILSTRLIAYRLDGQHGRTSLSDLWSVSSLTVLTLSLIWMVTLYCFGEFITTLLTRDPSYEALPELLVLIGAGFVPTFLRSYVSYLAKGRGEFTAVTASEAATLLAMFTAFGLFGQDDLRAVVWSVAASNVFGIVVLVIGSYLSSRSQLLLPGGQSEGAK